MIKQINSSRILVLSILILLAALTRLIPVLFPGAFNFTAVGALAIFAGAQLKDKRFAFIIPIVAMLISDMLIGFHSSMLIVYIAFAVMVSCGMFIRHRVTPLNVAIASIFGAIAFYLITNFAFLYPWYSHDMSGIIASYIAGIPFLRNMLIADLIYGILLFGTFYVLELKYEPLRYSILKSA